MDFMYSKLNIKKFTNLFDKNRELYFEKPFSCEMSNKTFDIILDTINEEEDVEIIAGKYILHEKLGEGSFGTVYKALDFDDNEYAIKFEEKTDLKKHLLRENTIYDTLKDLPDFPKKYYYGDHKEYRVLVLDKLGKSLKEIFYINNKNFDINTVANIAVQLLYRLENFHKQGWLHQDIKPENILIDNLDKKKIFLIDYGTSGYWWDKQLNSHVKKVESKKIVGTARYSCIRNHYGMYQNRTDDLESLGYVLIYFMRGYLPWQGIPAKNFRHKWTKVKRIKETTTRNVLCKNLPMCFLRYFQYIDRLSFTEKPDYANLRRLFRLYIISDFLWSKN